MADGATPVATNPLAVHAGFMVAVIALSVAVFALMLHSMQRERKRGGAPVQWRWALVPLGLLLAVELSLMGTPPDVPAGEPVPAADAPAR